MSQNQTLNIKPCPKKFNSKNDKYSDEGYTSLPKPDESESGQMVLK